jgi:hypothetical protein
MSTDEAFLIIINFFVKITKSKITIMKKIFTMTHIFARGFALAAVFALVAAPVTPAFAQSYGDDD